MTSVVPNEHSGDVVTPGMSRRSVVRAAGAGALALGLGGGALAVAAPTASAATRQGLSSVPQPPHLPAGFWNTFTSRYVNIGGGLRLHAVTGGDGPPLLLVHGWPETWYAWRLLMPALARDFRVVAVDQRGIGLSDVPADGYDTGTLADDLVTLMDALGHQRFALVGHDTGMPISYALAADHRDQVDRVAVAEAAMPGVAPSPPVFVPAALNNQLFHLMFNRLTELSTQLVTGREAIFFDYEFAIHAFKQLPDYAVRYYVDILTYRRDALVGSFGWYRALDTTIAQNEQRKTRPLALPVLAIGGAESLGEGPAESMKLAADNVQAVVIPDCGHWVAEEAPEQTLAALTAFLAPYRAVSGVGRLPS